MSAASAIVEHRREQIFPVLTAAQIETARRFGGATQHFKAGQIVYALDESHAPAFLVLEGSIEVVRRDGLGHESVITTHQAGQVSGEIGQLAGNPTLAEGRAGPQGCAAVPFNASQLRALLIGSAEIGELLMRAYILRRVALFDSGAGIVLLGAENSPHSLRLQNFLRRNGAPYTVLDPNVDAEAAQFIARLEIPESDLPLAISPDGTLLRHPTEAQLAQRVGLLPKLDPERTFDVAIVGAGPAGLAVAVYAASEGLSVLVLDSRAFGGQAGASARIENYLGFPTGISGQALMGRAFTQAEKFGAIIAIPAEVKTLQCRDDRVVNWRTLPPARQTAKNLQLTDGQSVRATTVVIATGVRYRRPALPELNDFEGRGLHYWASPIEAKLCTETEIVLVGAGNSAGQAVVFLASQVAKVHMLVRGPGLAASMSRYLIDRLQALPNLEMHTDTELTRLLGDEGGDLRAVRWRNRRTHEEVERPIRHVFLFIGADPNADWLKDCGVVTDEKGFVLTGADLTLADLRLESWSECQRRPAPLETSQPGIFAIGDVRAGSVKRVASAVGEGAAAVSQVHAWLAS